MSSLLINLDSSGPKLEQERLEHIGKQIKTLRKAQKMSQSDLGKRVGLSRRSISEIENGGNTTLASFMRILQVFSLLDDFNQLLNVSTISPRAAFEQQAKYGLK